MNLISLSHPGGAPLRGMAECCVVAEGFRSALRAPLHPSHCLPRPLRERPASGPLPLMCPRVDTPPATTQHIRQEIAWDAYLRGINSDYLFKMYLHFG